MKKVEPVEPAEAVEPEEAVKIEKGCRYLMQVEAMPPESLKSLQRNLNDLYGSGVVIAVGCGFDLYKLDI